MNQPNPSSNEVSMFNPESTGQIVTQRDAAAVARATQEIQAALVISQRFPRDEIKAKQRILDACKRPELAELAEYEYTRGGSKIVGPTIDLLRACANRWGNIRYGWTEVERRRGESSIRVFAWDVQTNGQVERTFVVKHWRDTREGGYELKDERDIYECLANFAARRVRACLEEVIDADVVDAAVAECRKTMKGANKTPISDRVVAMLQAFEEYGVNKEMIEAKLGNKLEAVSENQLAGLRRNYRSMKDGVATREDIFKVPATTSPQFATPQPASAATAGVSGSSPDDGDLAPATSAAPTTLPPPTPSADAAQTPDTNPLRTIRTLCKGDRIKEPDLLEYLKGINWIAAVVETLEEIQLQYPETPAQIVSQWNTISKATKAMVAAKAAEKK